MHRPLGHRRISSLKPQPVMLMCDVSVSTELSFGAESDTIMTKLQEMQSTIATLQKEALEYATKATAGYLPLDLIRNNDVNTTVYTGLPSYGVLVALERYPHRRAAHPPAWRDRSIRVTPIEKLREELYHLTIEHQLFAVLVRLRRGLAMKDMADRLGITAGQFSDVFPTWILFLSRELSLLFPWPTRELVQVWMPASFKKQYPSIRAIIDCLELQIQRPLSLMWKLQTFSQYKSRNIFKVLVAISPGSLVSFGSDDWGGRVLDHEISRNAPFPVCFRQAIQLWKTGDLT